MIRESCMRIDIVELSPKDPPDATETFDKLGTLLTLVRDKLHQMYTR
jgi:hypothetical protein